MIRLRHKLLIHSFQVLDQAMLVGTAGALIYFRPEIAEEGSRLLRDERRFSDLLGMLLLLAGWISIFHYCVRYKADRFVAFTTQLKDLVKATTVSSFWFVIVSALFSVRSVNPGNILLFWTVVTGLGVLGRLWLRVMLMSARRSGYNFRFLLIVGSNPRAFGMAEKIEKSPELGYKTVGFVAEDDEAALRTPPGGGKVLGSLDDLQSVLKMQRVDEIMVCLPLETRFKDVGTIVRHARDLNVVVRIMPDVADGLVLRNLHVEEFDGDFVVTLFREQLLLQLFLKRLVDATVSFVALVLLLPLMLVVAILIKLSGPGPVIFSQDRVGMNQRRFRLYKFRSMVADAEARKDQLEHLNERDGPVFKIDDDPRVTRIGRFIRKTSIDELPQLFNVLRGEMSLVGPRPPLPTEVDKYEWMFRKRLSVKPGITCVWQISGRNHTSFERWMQMDRDYIENWSIWLDLKILIKTIPAVLTGRGAS